MCESSGNTDFANSIGNDCAKRILKLLKDGEEKIDFRSIQNAVIILGNTGAGKTTFGQFLAGDNDRLISNEIGEYTGEFIISDFDDKISVDSIIISKTTFPELMYDAHTNTAYIDTPGFNDSRNEAYDVATAYFIKKVFGMVKNVKIVLAISHPSLRKGVNRTDFLQLLEHLTVLFKDIDRYIDCIALVATKVDNTFMMYQGAPVLIPDTAIIENIAKFLTEVKKSLKVMQDGGNTYTSELKRVENKLFYQNAIKLLDTLLLKEDSKYTRLGIFRRPDQVGPVSRIEILQAGKTTIKNMLFRNQRYLSTEKAEIGYTLSDKSKTVIRDLVVEINNNIVANMAIINTNLITYYQDLEAKMFSDDMYLLRDHLKSALEALSRITSVNESVSVTDFVDIMRENFTKIGVRVSQSRLRDITNLGKFLGFLQNISVKKYVSFVWKWTNQLDEATSHVNNSLKWYNFLISLYNRLSDYDVQKNRSSYSVPTFNTLPSEGLLVKNSKDFVDFLDAVTDQNVFETVYYEEIKEIRLNNTKIKFFDRIAQITLRDELVYTNLHPDQCFQVVGEYVLLSEVITNKLYEKCQSAQIFAKHTVFVDASLKKNNVISIIAPRWEIINKQSINLDGDDAPSHHPTKAYSGRTPGGKGEDGKPGLPGGSAGYFFGVGSQFRNMRNLHISANGGRGGCGQDGGDGAAGGSQYHNYTGGDAGCGGAGGIGGHKGYLITVDTSNGDGFASAVKKPETGEVGSNGKPGYPGRGGYYTKSAGRGRSMPYNTMSVSTYTHQGDFGKQAYKVSEEGQLTPSTKEFLSAPSLIISNYRNELVNNLGDSVKKHHSLLFIQEIQSNHTLCKYYDEYTLSSELRHLEKYYRNFTIDTAIILYDSILKNILQVVKSRTEKFLTLESLYFFANTKLLLLRTSSSNHIASSELHTTFERILSTSKLLIADSDIVFISSTLDLFKENILIPTIESIDAQIIALSDPTREEVDDDLRKLGNLLLQRKVLSVSNTLAQFLHYLTNMALIDRHMLDQMRIVQIVPFIKFKPIKIEPWIKNQFENDAFQFVLDVAGAHNILNSLVSTERRMYEKSVDPKIDIIDDLRDIEQEITSTEYENVKFFSTTGTIEIVKTFMEILLEIVENLNPNEREMIRQIEIRIKLLEFDDQLYRQVCCDRNIDRLFEALTRYCIVEKQNYFIEMTERITEILNIVPADIGALCDPNKMSEVRTTVMEFINSVSTRMSRITKQCDIVSEVRSVIENLLEVVKLVQNMYQRIVLEEFKTHLYEPSCRFESSDTMFLHLLKNFDLHAYRHTVDVFRRSVFPFGLLDPDIITIPSIPDDTFAQSPQALKESLKTSVNILQTTLNTLLKASSYPNILKGCTPLTENRAQIFKWKNSSIATQVTHLLRGRQIALTASVNPTDDHQCLRFNSIRLRFKTHDETQQSKLNDVLCKFTIRMIHSGNSSYAFCDRVYSFDEERCEYQCTNDTDAQSEHPKSPYTMWLFSLLPVDENVTYFRSLGTFIYQPIDLQLEGCIKYFKIEDKSLVYESLENSTMDADYFMLTNRRVKDLHFLEQDDVEPST